MGDVNDLTAPQHYAHIAPPMRAGLSVAAADQVVTPHRCGRCNNGTGIYNPDCPNNKGAA